MLEPWQNLLVVPEEGWSRKAYLVAGSDAQASRAAIAHTILGNYLLADIEPWRSLRDVLAKPAAG